MPLSSSACAFTKLARGRSPVPSLWATSVWVPTPRKLNTQNTLVSTAAPTPSPASGAAPRRATKTVSTSPVSGSAMSEKSSGVVRRRKVPCGCRTKGCGESDKIEDGREGQVERTSEIAAGTGDQI